MQPRRLPRAAGPHDGYAERAARARVHAGRVVVDGRDIGTIVCPDADIKFFVTASAEERARRRSKELETRGETADFRSILEEIARRDERDRTRAVAPLKAAPDAHLLDTTNLDIEAALRAAVAIVDGERLRGLDTSRSAGTAVATQWWLCLVPPTTT